MASNALRVHPTSSVDSIPFQDCQKLVSNPENMQQPRVTGDVAVEKAPGPPSAPTPGIGHDSSDQEIRGLKLILLFISVVLSIFLVALVGVSQHITLGISF
jgi:hypothetical protein